MICLRPEGNCFKTTTQLFTTVPNLWSHDRQPLPTCHSCRSPPLTQSQWPNPIDLSLISFPRETQTELPHLPGHHPEHILPRNSNPDSYWICFIFSHTISPYKQQHTKLNQQLGTLAPPTGCSSNPMMEPFITPSIPWNGSSLAMA